MAGASAINRRVATVVETTVGTTPSTPAFIESPWNSFDFTETQNPTVIKALKAQGQASGITRGSRAITASASGDFGYGVYDDFLASLFQSSWNTNVLVNGLEEKAFSAEDSVDKNGTRQYQFYKGVHASGGSIAFPNDGGATISMDFIGMESSDVVTTGLSGATYTEAANVVPFRSSQDTGLLVMDSIAYDCVSSVTLNFTLDGKAVQNRVFAGNQSPCGVSEGGFMLTIDFQFYVEGNYGAVFNAARNGTEFGLKLPIGTVTGQKYLIEMPRCQFLDPGKDNPESGPLLLNVTAQALIDDTLQGTCKITRAVA